MKHKFPVAILLAAFIFLASSCEFFSDNKAPANPLIGKWHIDSIGPVSDKDAIAFLLVALNRDDKERVDFEFTKDSLFSYLSDSSKNAASYTWLDKMNAVVVNDVFPETLLVLHSGDSSLMLRTKDSSVMHLRKR